MTNRSIKETVREMYEWRALLVHRSVVNPRDTRSSFTVLNTLEISCKSSSAPLDTILEGLLGSLTLRCAESTLISFWKLSPYCLKEVQVSVMCSIKASSNLSSNSLSMWGLKKSSLGLFRALPP